MITGGIEEIVKHITYFVMEILPCALYAHYNFLYYFHSYFYTQPFLYAKKQVFPTEIKDVLQLKLL